MNKILKIMQIELPMLIVLLASLVITCLTGISKVTDGTLEEGIQAILTVMVSIVPIVLFIPIGIALLIIEICLCIKSSKRGSLIALLVFLCILLPVLAFYLFMSLSLIYELIYFDLISIVTIIIFINLFVFSCILIKNKTY